MKRFFFPLFVILLIIPQTYSQQRLGLQPHFNRLETLRQVKLIETLELDEETAARFIVIQSEMRKREKELVDKLDNLLDSLKISLEKEVDVANLSGIIRSVEEMRDAIHAHRKEMRKRVGELLDTRQAAQFIVFERDFTRDVRILVRDTQRHRIRARERREEALERLQLYRERLREERDVQ